MDLDELTERFAELLARRLVASTQTAPQEADPPAEIPQPPPSLLFMDDIVGVILGEDMEQRELDAEIQQIQDGDSAGEPGYGTPDAIPSPEPQPPLEEQPEVVEEAGEAPASEVAVDEPQNQPPVQPTANAEGPAAENLEVVEHEAKHFALVPVAPADLRQASAGKEWAHLQERLELARQAQHQARQMQAIVFNELDDFLARRGCEGAHLAGGLPRDSEGCAPPRGGCPDVPGPPKQKREPELRWRNFRAKAHDALQNFSVPSTPPSTHDAERKRRHWPSKRHRGPQERHRK